MKASQVFAAARQACIAEAINSVHTDLLPSFTAEAEDIRRKHEEDHPAAPALADHRKHARTLDLVHRRNNFIAALNASVKDTLTTKVAELGGKLEEVEEDRNGKTVKVIKAFFADGSKASFPKGLWIDNKLFPRV